MDAFELIDEWPVATVACGVVTADGRRWVCGDENRPFALASVTKPLAALAVMVAVEEGVLELDTAAGPPRSTVEHLLSHASGLAPDQRRLLTEPGRRRIYSNSGYEVLAETLETAAEMSFAEYFAEGVGQPLGLTATDLSGSPAHGGTSSVADLLAVAAELLAGGDRLLASATAARLRSPSFPHLPGVLPGFGLQDPNSWGLGFEIRGTKHPHWTGDSNSPATYGHFGRAGTFVWIDPDAGAACVALTDREFGEWAMRRWPSLSDAVLDAI